MRIGKTLLPVVLALVLLSSPVMTALAADEAQAAPYIRQIINFYQYYQDDAQTDIGRLTAEMGKVDPSQALKWEAVIDCWSWVNNEMEIGTGVLSDGLPDDTSLCIVVLGYQLQEDGSMKDELVGRLEAALASAEKYPNAYIACTGGGTADKNHTATEAEQMADWLEDHGIDRSRMIIESESRSTVQNAQYTYAILRDAYPQIRHLALVTSDYHMARGSLL